MTASRLPGTTLHLVVCSLLKELLPVRISALKEIPSSPVTEQDPNTSSPANPSAKLASRSVHVAAAAH